MATREITYQSLPYRISYEIINPQCNDTIMILHGWGSNKEIMQGAFSKHLSQHKHLYIDLPGFGKSPNETILQTKDYAQIVRLFLESLNIQPSLIIGHSFGGKVATLLTPHTLALLSSAGIPTPKSLKVRSKIKLFKLLKPLGLGKWRQLFASKDVEGMNQAMYETFKNVVDEDFSADFKAYPHKALIFWGKEDSATVLSSGEKISKLIKHSDFYPLEGDHFFFTKHADFISQTLQKELHG
jgi:pimeloyl-ACP methyl ester carboxylesterase